MTPKQMARLGVFQIQESILSVLEQEPEGLETEEISTTLGIPDCLIVRGVLAKLQREGYIEPAVGERWKIVGSDDRNIWTVERFRELISDDRHGAVYEHRGQIESLSELGADLMNFVAKNQWELTHKCTERNFSFYFGRRLVFGINLHAQTARLCVWVPEDDVIDRENDWIDCGIMNRGHEEYYSSSGCAVYPRGVEVADIEEMLAFAYAWRSGGLE